MAGVHSPSLDLCVLNISVWSGDGLPAALQALTTWRNQTLVNMVNYIKRWDGAHFHQMTYVLLVFLCVCVVFVLYNELIVSCDAC